MKEGCSLHLSLILSENVASAYCLETAHSRICPSMPVQPIMVDRLAWSPVLVSDASMDAHPIR